MSKKSKSLKSCAAFIILISILIPLGLNNISLFLFTTDICWVILNYLDDSSKEYNGYFYLHDDAYSPVTHQVIDYNLKVSGIIPDECAGAIFKISPNPRFKQNVAGKYNWFDGDGMVHAIKLIPTNNTAHYSNSYMNTLKYQMESKYNRSLYSSSLGAIHSNGIIGFIKMQLGRFIMEHPYSPLCLDQLRSDHGLNTKYGERGEANTAFLHLNNKLFALHEPSQPFEFKYNSKTAEIISIGYYDFNKSWNWSFTAHPKIDSYTNQLFTHGAYLEPAGGVIVGMTDNKNPNRLIRSKRIKLNSPQMMHEMMITQKYIIILDLNLHFGKETFIQSNYSRIFEFSKKINSRIGILVRGQLLNQKKQSNVRWFDIKPCGIFHLVNGWDGNDEITLIGHRYDQFDLNAFQISKSMNNAEINHYVDDHELYKWRINLRNGKVEEGKMNGLDDKLYKNEFYPVMPLVNPRFKGRRNRFMFSAIYKNFNNKRETKTVGILKYDFDQETVVNTIMYGNDDNGNSEFMIVPKKNNNGDEEEDDIYIASMIYNYKNGKSRVEIHDGKSMNDKAVATVELNRKIPVGFHGLFVNQNDLDVMDNL